MKKPASTGDLRTRILKALLDKSMHTYDLIAALRLPPQPKNIREVEHWLGVLEQQGYVAHARQLTVETSPRWWVTDEGRLHCRTG